MKVQSARTIDEAVTWLADAGEDATLLSGGTDLMVEFDIGRTKPDQVIDLWAVDELRGIREEQGGVRLGALTTCSDLLASALVEQKADILHQAAADFGAVQIRNRATLGGNLGTASPAADLNPVLLALDASVRLVSRQGTREVPADDFLVDYRTNARRPDELIESIWIGPRPEGERRRFRKVGTRSAQSIAKVVLATSITLEKENVTRARIAAGSVAARTLLLPSVAAELVGHPLTRERAERAAARASEDCTPQDDVRSTAAYRSAVLERVIVRLLT